MSGLKDFITHLKIREIDDDSLELQIKGGIEENSKIIFHISQQNICCDPSLEPPR